MMQRRRALPGVVAGLLLLLLPPAARAQPDWSPAGTYTASMAVIAVVHFDGVASDDPADLLAGFAGGVSRGVASPVNLGGTYVYFLSLGGDTEGEALSFKAYDASTGAERPLCEGVNFRKDAIRGSLASPFTFFTADGADACALHWAVPPGFSTSMTTYVALYIDGVRSADPADRVAAVVGNEVRGVGVPFQAGGAQVFSIEVAGDTGGEPIQFRGYEAGTGATHVLSGEVTFAAGSTVGTPGAPLVLSTSGGLPVELAHLAAYADGPTVVLRWTTASETNNAGFFVEHRPAEDPQGWRTAGFVPGHGTTTTPRHYTYRLPGLTPGPHVLRLRQVDFDGRVTHTEGVRVTVDTPGAFALTAPSPNPTAGRATATLTVAVRQPVVVTLHDVLGRVVRTLFSGEVAPHRPRRLAVETGDLPAGVYLLRVQGATFTATRLVTRAR